MRKIDPVLYAMYSSSYAALRLSNLLPNTDICEQLKDLLVEQCTFVTEVLEGERFLLRDIENFIEDCERIAKQAEELDAFQE